MGIIIGILLVLFVLSAIFLVLIILAQDDGTEGAGIIFGSAASQQYGARKGNIVTRTTSILATSFMVLAFTLSFLYQFGRDDTFDNIDVDNAESTQWWDTSIQDETEEIPLTAPASSFSDEDETPNKNIDTETTDTEDKSDLPLLDDGSEHLDEQLDEDGGDTPPSTTESE